MIDAQYECSSDLLLVSLELLLKMCMGCTCTKTDSSDLL